MTQQTTERRVGRAAQATSPATPVAEESPPKVATMATRIRTTIGEYGDKLPIGILDRDGRLHKDIVCKPWKTRDERELGKKLASDAGMIEHVPLVVANMCSRIGPHNMDTIPDGEKSVILSTMYMADVFYAYTLLRTKTMGHRLQLQVSCPRAHCGATFPYTGDLRTTEVMAVEDIDSILRKVDLEDPITIRKKHVTHFMLAAPKWSVMDQGKGSINEADIKAYVLQGTIVGINDDQEPVSLTLNEIDELSKRDFEGLQENINKNFLGPKMGLEGKCTPEVCERFRHGGVEFKLPIDWNYRNFFGGSSR
jgi:hypothetical protein